MLSMSTILLIMHRSPGENPTFDDHTTYRELPELADDNRRLLDCMQASNLSHLRGPRYSLSGSSPASCAHSTDEAAVDDDMHLLDAKSNPLRPCCRTDGKVAFRSPNKADATAILITYSGTSKGTRILW